MRISIVLARGYLRAELWGRNTAQETQEFLSALALEALKHSVSGILIIVQSSRPIFKVEDYQASAYLKELANRPSFRVALVSSDPGVRAAHGYVELLATQSGASVRSFGDEPLAVQWLQGGAPGPGGAAGLRA